MKAVKFALLAGVLVFAGPALAQNAKPCNPASAKAEGSGNVLASAAKPEGTGTVQASAAKPEGSGNVLASADCK